MIAKKNPKFNEDKRRGVYFQLGLMVVGASTMMAFTWRSPIHVKSNVSVAERSADIPEIKVHEEIKKPEIKEPKIEKVEPPKKIELKKTKDLNQDLDVQKNKDVDEKSAINDERFKNIIDGKFDVDIGERPELNTVVKFPKKEARFKGSWLGFLKKTVVYPELSKELGDQAKIFVSFIVEKDGSITQVEVQNKTTPKELQKEALRVVRSAPDWIPGIGENGEYVRTNKTVTINFVLK